MEKKKPQEIFCFEFPSDLKILGDVLDWFTQVSESRLSATCFMQCQTILAEGFTNAVRHAHKDHPQETLIKVQLMFYNNYLEIQVCDFGEPFDLIGELNKLLQKEAKEGASFIDLDEGGRGLKFINAFADQLNYIRDEFHDKNYLIMQKNFG